MPGSFRTVISILLGMK